MDKRDIRRLASSTVNNTEVQNIIDNDDSLVRWETMPRVVSFFENDKPYLTSAPVMSVNGQTGNVILSLFNGDYTNLINKPLIPTLLSQLTNDVGFITASVLRPVVTYKGTTNTSGNFTVTYPTAYNVIPDVQVQLIGATTSQRIRVISSTTTGFTAQVVNRGSVTLLATEVLLAATTPVSGASVSALVTTHI